MGEREGNRYRGMSAHFIVNIHLKKKVRWYIRITKPNQPLPQLVSGGQN